MNIRDLKYTAKKLDVIMSSIENLTNDERALKNMTLTDDEEINLANVLSALAEQRNKVVEKLHEKGVNL